MNRKDELRTVAERLVRRSGFNSMSFADLSAAVGIKTASVHYHYPTKTDLGVDLIDHYHEAFFAKLSAQTETVASSVKRLQRYGALFEDGLVDSDGLCLCGVLAAELPSLHETVRERVIQFFEANTKWLAAELKRGDGRDELNLPRSANQTATALFSALEGSMFVARALQNPRHIRETVAFFVAALAT